ncbi:MAG: hypothetical protein IT337_03285 [Thermomicrobiales bacterium]|nr:hypothetical protein [Thermomicrobiales bacterium]
MRRSARVALATIAAAATAVAAAAKIAAFRGEIRNEIDELFAAEHLTPGRVVAEEDLARLPTPVARWLRRAGVVGKRIPRTVRLRQEGEFRLAPGGRWMPFTADEYFSLDPPGFVWVVRMEAAPLLAISGRDRYAGGEGSIDMRLLELIPVASQRGGLLNQGALLRYLNETMWFPAAALDPCISWSEIDEHRAQATISYGGMDGSAIFVFDADGRLLDMTADRYYAAGNRTETWSTPLSNERLLGGMRVPASGYGLWKLGVGDFIYIRLRVTDLDYDPAGPY